MADRDVSRAREYFDRSDLPRAEAELRSVLLEGGPQLDARLLLGVICAQTARLDEAEQLLGSALKLAPDNYDALTWLGVVKKQQNDLLAAVRYFQRALSLRRDDPVAFTHLGLCWLGMRQPVEAADSFANVIKLEPGAAQGYFNLGMALKLPGNCIEAFHAFKKAAQLDPNYLPSYVQAFKQMRHLLNWEDGLALFEDGFERHPDSISIRVALAVTYGKTGKEEEAEKLFVDAANSRATAGPPYAHWLQEQGRFEEANPVLAKSIELDPTLGDAYYNLAVAKCFRIGDKPLLEAAIEALNIPGLKPKPRMFLLYAIAKSYEHLRDFERAMEYYDRANAWAYQIYNSREKFDPNIAEASLAYAKKTYPQDTTERARAFGSSSEVPVFIVGMIRSGTTLLDQILSSHPSIASVGEQSFWGLTSYRFESKLDRVGLEAKNIALLGEKYLETIQKLAGNTPRIVDKMPVNYNYLGLIHLALPQARIIHLRRSPMDTCVSIYTTYLGDATYFAYDQANIVGTYKAYLRLMEYWRTILPPDRLLEVDYEDLVANEEPVIRKILEFCGLEWDDACLSHESNNSQISTPSLFTARQPVNTDSVAKWHRFERWLGALLELKEFEHPATGVKHQSF